MLRTPSRPILGYTRISSFLKWRFYQSLTRSSTSAAAVEKQDRVKINNESALNAGLSQPHRLTSTEPVAAVNSSSGLPLLDPLDAKATQLAELSAVKIEHPSIDKSPQPFEEIPGPALLKLWEKYWKYVPVIGTQLFRSALINELAEGRLLWNRNVSPIKYLFNKYGPVVRLNGPLTGDIVLIHRPEHVAKVFEAEGDSPARSGIDVLQHYRLNYRKYRFAGPYNAEGVQGAEWLQAKKSLEAPIAEQIDKQFGKLEMACDELVLRIRQIRNRQDEVPGNFNMELSRWGMECFWVLMLDKKMGFLDPTGYNDAAETTRFVEALSEAHHYLSHCETGFQVWRFIDTLYVKRLFSSCDVLDGVIGKYIRMAQNSGRDESTSLRSSGKDKQINSTILENLLIKRRWSPDDVSTLMMDMVLLGVQATANSQAFLLYYLAKNPRIQRTLFDEIVAEMKKSPILTKKSFDNMPYMSACIKECFRLRPPFPYLTRLLPNNITLHGYKVPKGTYIIMANQISSQKEENFEDSEKFKPERWLASNDDFYQKNSYLPFGKGLRSCIGEHMAKLQMKLLTAKIIREFKVEYDYADIGSRFLMLNVPNKQLRFRFVERN